MQKRTKNNDTNDAATFGVRSLQPEYGRKFVTLHFIFQHLLLIGFWPISVEATPPWELSHMGSAIHYEDQVHRR